MAQPLASLPLPRPDATALVTGASSGIGDAFARRLSRLGHHVTAIARRADRLAALTSDLPNAEAFVCDVARAQSRNELLEHLTREGREVDILINCAGFGGGGPVYEYDPERAVEMLRTNTEAVYAFCGALTPGMALRKSGAVVVVSSLAGILHPPVRFAAYGASKRAALSYTQGLHYEMSKVGVAVTALCPGPVDTEFGASSGLERTMDAMPGLVKATPDQCVSDTLSALSRGRSVAIPNRAVRFAAGVARWTPASVAARLLPVGFRV